MIKFMLLKFRIIMFILVKFKMITFMLVQNDEVYSGEVQNNLGIIGLIYVEVYINKVHSVTLKG